MLHNDDARSTKRCNCELGSVTDVSMIHEVQAEGLSGRGQVSASGA
jgi:hypothetical protein